MHSSVVAQHASWNASVPHTAPPLSGEDVERVEIRFNRFGAGKGMTKFSDFRLWRRK